MVAAIEPVTIKLYGNQRLMRPDAARYVICTELMDRARRGTGVVVRDARTGTDITQSILAHGTSEH